MKNQNKIENPFKKIIQEIELPEAMKDKVINNVNLIKLSLELSELFLVSIPDVVFNFMETEKKKEADEDPDNTTEDNNDYNIEKDI
ncbi:MAG TPA: hypothetical protein VKY33_07980 [Flavobacterium sp.]|nr:hypothetical protein [Flavobacterium sp.]